ncbi:MAG: leucine-rich repeat domain-containing protein [Prevotella sp.]|nr:leucine-rich repeat domain-containing protein [Prevotella sp.]
MNKLTCPTLLILLLSLVTTVWAQQSAGEMTDYHCSFQDTAYLNGRPLLVTFSCHPKKKKLATVGVGEYGRPAIDTTAAGRLVLPDSVTDCFGRRRLVTGVGRQAFAHCTRLTEVVMPDSLTSISDQAFYGCTALREVTLPPALIVIYPFAFRGCRQLSVVRVKCPKRPAVYDNIFDQQTLDRATLFVPAGRADHYANSLVFGMFHYRFEELE